MKKGFKISLTLKKQFDFLISKRLIQEFLHKSINLSKLELQVLIHKTNTLLKKTKNSLG